ncbi:MAG: hypothetical protein HY263_07170 [Chloroflexi bacterium]|nr:hypothetical protein [Chloroflexota bacterium]
MTAIVLPDLDRSTLEDLKQRMPSLRLADVELPSMERAGRQADEVIGRLLGRSRPPIWTWLAAAVGIAAIVGTVAAVLSWGRRPSWLEPAGSGLPGASSTGMPDAGIDEADFAIDAGHSPFEEPLP